MTIRGFLDSVDALQIRGWAYDPTRPENDVPVSVTLDGSTIAAATANLFRDDLAKAGVGTGFHSFVVNLERHLSPEERLRVAVVAGEPGNSKVFLPRVTPSETAIEPEGKKARDFQARPIDVPDPVQDDTQRPVFILGAARSGTSALTQGLLKLGIFEGHEEGHVFDLMAHFAVTLTKFYDLKFDEISLRRNTAISRIPIALFNERLDFILVDLARRLFPSARWIDKTPNSDMVHLAPRFRKIWPQSRFIFMRRRFLENAASRARKFPDYAFERNAQEWGHAMGAWLQVRSQLHGTAIEIDQKFLKDEPQLVANRLADFLSLSAKHELLLLQALRHDLPERTATGQESPYNISNMGWGDQEKAFFDQYCKHEMLAFGYSVDESYFRDGFEDNGFSYI
jgi:hypothetical protein